MKALVFYRKSDTNRLKLEMNELKKNLAISHITSQDIDADSPAGAGMAEAYDIMSFPAVLLMREDGVAQKVWQGTLPSNNEIHESIGFI